MIKRDKTILWRWVLPLSVLFVVMLIFIICFSNATKAEAVSDVNTQLIDEASKYALKLDQKFRHIKTAGEMTCAILSIQGIEGRSTNVQQCLQAVVEKTGVYLAIFVKKNGEAFDQNGNPVEIENISYIETLDSSDKADQFLFLTDDEIQGRSCLLLKIPAKDGRGELLLYYPLEAIAEQMNTGTENHEDTFALIMSSDGTIKVHNNVKTNFTQKANLWDNVDSNYNVTLNKAKRLVKGANAQGVLQAAAQGEERSLVYVSLDIADSLLVLGVDQKYVEERQQYLYRSGNKTTYQLASIFAIFLVVIVVLNVVNGRKSVENSKVLEEKADTDLLTGLNNKLATERKIKEYMREHPNSKALLFVLDIDNFKKINDTMGHAFGDEVLRELGRYLGSNFRVTDVVGRTGGDEFTIFLKNLKDDPTTIRESQKLINFFRSFQVGEYVKYSATASIGAAVFPEDGKDFESMYKAADQALYKAKKRGKNQLAFYDDRDRKTENVQSDH